MKPASGDLRMFTKIFQDSLVCPLSVYVDNTISTGPLEFEEESGTNERKFN